MEHSVGPEDDSKLPEGAEVGDNAGGTVDTALKFGVGGGVGGTVGGGVGGAKVGTLVLSKLAEGDNIGREVGAKLKSGVGGGVGGAQPLQHSVQQGQLTSSQSALRTSKIAMLQTSDGTCPRRLL